MEEKAKMKINPWMIACISLVVMIFVSIIVVISMVTSLPTIYQESDAVRVVDGQAIAEISINRAGMNSLIYNTIPELEQGQTAIDITIHDKIVVSGEYEIEMLGLIVPFALQLNPVALDDGNILLESEGLHIGLLELPTDLILAFIAEVITLPPYIYIQGENILIRLDQLELHNVKVRAVEIDLSFDVAYFELYL